MDEKTGAVRLSASGKHGQANAWLWWLLPAAWMGLIFFLSAQPDLVIAPDVWWDDLASTAAHVIEYAILAGLLWLALRKTPALTHQALLLAFVIAFVYALSDELHQSFVPNRVPDPRDILADAVGAGIALALIYWHITRAARRRT